MPSALAGAPNTPTCTWNPRAPAWAAARLAGSVPGNCCCTVANVRSASTNRPERCWLSPTRYSTHALVCGSAILSLAAVHCVIAVA